MNRIRAARYLLTLVLASLGFWGMTAAEPGPMPKPIASTTEVKTEPMKAEVPNVTVNGQVVPTGQDGTTVTNVLDDGTKVERLDGRTEVSSSGDVNITVTSRSEDVTGVVQVFSQQYSSTNESSQQSVVSSNTQSTIEVSQ